MNSRHEQRANELLNEYVQWTRDATTAYRHDAEFHTELQIARRWLSSMDSAMANEEVSETARDRVLRTVAFGAPDPRAALDRIEERRRLIDVLQQQPINLAAIEETR